MQVLDEGGLYWDDEDALIWMYVIGYARPCLQRRGKEGGEEEGRSGIVAEMDFGQVGPCPKIWPSLICGTVSQVILDSPTCLSGIDAGEVTKSEVCLKSLLMYCSQVRVVLALQLELNWLEHDALRSPPTLLRSLSPPFLSPSLLFTAPIAAATSTRPMAHPLSLRNRCSTRSRLPSESACSTGSRSILIPEHSQQ